MLNYGSFRSTEDASPPATDVEDLFTPATYLTLFNGAYANELGGKVVTESALPPGARIVDRLTRYLKASDTAVRSSGGFNHYRPASFLASTPQPLDPGTLDHFERLFRAVNALFT